MLRLALAQRIGDFPRFHTQLHGIMPTMARTPPAAETAPHANQAPTAAGRPALRATPRKRGRPPKAAPAPGADEAASSRATFTPDTWVQAALDVLEREGVDAIRVDVLAKRLGVTRGSFYWHFKDRDELLQAVLQTWHDGATQNLTRRLESASPDPRDQLRDVLTLPYRGKSAERASRIELAIRAWARWDARVRQVVDESDASRIGYIAQIFSGLGFAPAEARHRAFMVYSMDVGGSLVGPLNEMAQRGEWLDFAQRLMRGDPQLD